MKPNVLALLPDLIPSTLIHVVTPLIDLHKSHRINARVKLELFANNQDIGWSDLIILCRNVEPDRAGWFLKVIEDKKPFVYDVDDNFFELDTNTPSGKYYKTPERMAMLEEYIRRASLVRVYSGPMFERAKSLNPRTQKVNGYVDWRLVTPVSRPLGKQPVKIVYATSRVDDNLAEIFKPALKKILEEYTDQIQVFFLGYNPPEFQSYPNVFFKPLSLNYEKYMRYFSSAGFDIGLAPLLEDVFHRSKTNLKAREFGACRIAGIYSDVDTYSTSITHSKNGLLVSNSVDAWYNAISTLIQNHELRTHIQEQAYQYALVNFSREAFIQVWHSQIIETLNRSSNKSVANLNTQFMVFDHDQENNVVREKISIIRTNYFIWLGGILHRLISGIKSKGITFLFSYIRMKIQVFWMLLKIKISLY